MSAPAPVSTIACPFCSASNQSDRRFCVGCGEELRDECPKCRFAISSGDSFCSGCGYNVKDHYQKQVDEIESRMKEVEDLIVEDKYDDAIAVLSLLNRYQHQRIRETRAHVEKLYTMVKQKRDKRVQEVLALCDSAKLYATTGLISSAINEFERAPAHMLPPKAKAMLQELRFKHSTIERLKEQIKQQVASKRFIGLLPDIAKLLSLSTDESEYEQLGTKVASRLAVEAKKLVAASKYKQAYNLSLEFVDRYQTEETNRLTAVIRDRLCLEHIAKKKLVCDKGLLEVLQKLGKLDPKYPHLNELSSTITKLLNAKTNENRLNIRTRTKSGQTVIPSVQPWELAGVASIKFAKPEFEKASVRFLDCLGLGLQAITEVPLQHSFSSSKSGSLFSMFGSKKQKLVWGVVIEGTTLRAIRMSASNDSKDDRPVVDQMLVIPYTDNEPTEGRLRQCQQSVLAKFQHKLKDAPGELVIGLSPRNVLPRFFTIPQSEQKKLVAAIEMELQHQSPFGKDQVLQRYEVFDDTTAQAARPVMGTIVRKSDLEGTIEVYNALGLKPLLVQSTPQAIFNLLNREWFEHQHKLTQDDQGLICVDVGDELTTFISVWKRRFWWRYIPIGRRDLVSQITRSARLTTEQASKVLDRPALAPKFDLMLEGCVEFYEKLIAELQRSQNQAEQFMSGLKTPNLICSGVALPYLIDALKFGADSLLPWSESDSYDDQTKSAPTELIE